MKMFRAIVVMLSLVMIVAGVGCVAVSKWATPATVDQAAVKYVVDAGVASASDYAGWANLLKALKLERDVETTYALIMLELEQLIQSEELNYSIHKDVTSRNRTVAQESEEMLFGEKGLLSMGLGLAGMGTLTGVLGLMRKRPQDLTPEEVKAAIAQATGDTNIALTLKEKQFVDVVKGVQGFLDEYKDTTDNKAAVIIKALKTQLSKFQDTSTQVAVAQVKVS
jgi:hypothetical protein